MAFFYKIQNKIAIFSAFFLVLAIIIMLIIVKWGNDQLHTQVIQQTVERLTEDTTAELKAVARAEASSIALEMVRSADVAISLRETVESLLEQETLYGINQEELSILTRDVLTKNNRLVGTYITLLADKGPRADDARYGHTSGQFAPYWSRAADGSVSLSPLSLPSEAEANTQPTGRSQWYYCPLTQQTTCLVEPFTWTLQGQRVVGTAITTPIMIDGEVVGLAGVDLVLSYLTQLTQKLSAELYEGQGRVRIISAGGKVAADSQTQQNSGQPLNDKAIGHIQDLLLRQAPSVIDHPDDFIVVAPIRIPGLSAQWGIVVNVPKAIALERVEHIHALLDEGFADSLSTMLLCGFVVAFLGAILMALVARSIAQPILSAGTLVNKLAQQDGDLTQRVKVARHKDEIHHLSQGMNKFIEKTHHIVKDIAGEMSNVEGAAHKASDISKATNLRVQQQRNEIELIASAIKDMSAAANEVAQSAAATATAANEATEAVTQGSSHVKNNASTIRVMGERMDQVSAVMNQLAQDSQGISHIVEVISDISEQTNLLALNAAIEAARAGDQGRGFSVVADEVRNLATKTQHSTLQIQQLIDQLQQRSTEAVAEIAKGTEYTQSCIAQADDVAIQLETVVSAISKIDQMSSQIASASEEQRAVTEDVTANVERISSAVNAVAEDASATNSESQRLLALVNALEAQLRRFKF